MSFGLITDSKVNTLRVNRTGQLPIVDVASTTPLKALLAYNNPDDTLYFADGTEWHQLATSNTDASFTSITLSTPGGIPTPLNYYEEFTINTTIVGPWATPLPFTMNFVRVGKMCTFDWSEVPADVVTTLVFLATAASNIPSRFIPGGGATRFIPCTVFSNTDYMLGSVSINTAGLVRYGPVDPTTLSRTGFALGTNAGINAGSVTYKVA